MYPALDSAVPPISNRFEGRELNTDVDEELLGSDLPWIVDADNSKSVRQNTAASAADEPEPLVRVPETLTAIM